MSGRSSLPTRASPRNGTGGWAQQEPNALAAAYDRLARNPTEFSSRQKKLEGKTWATGTYEGMSFERWQFEVTAGAGSSISSKIRLVESGDQSSARVVGRSLADE